MADARDDTQETDTALGAVAATPPESRAPTEAGSNPTLYIACHDRNPGLSAQPFKPIHVGRARGGRPLPGTIGDNQGDNISALNDQVGI